MKKIMQVKANKIQKTPVKRLPLLWLVVGLCGLPQTHAATQPVSEPLDRIVAVVNEAVITAFELEEELRTIKRQLRAQNAQMPDDKTMSKQILDRMVLTRIQLQRAEERNIRIDDEALNKALQNIAGQNGLNVEQLRAELEKDGIKFETFRDNIREQMLIGQLQQREVNSQINVTEPEVDNFLRNREIRGSQDDQYLLQHILVSVPEAATANEIQMAKAEAGKLQQRIKAGEDFAQLAIAFSSGQQALTGGDLGWRRLEQLPTLFADVAVNMKIGETSEAIRSASGFHLVRLVDKRRNEETRIIRQTEARHILIRTTELQDIDQAKTRLLQLKQRIEGGEDFATLAKVHSDDKASGAAGGDLGWVNPGVMVAEFESAMDKLAIGVLSDPVKTQFGWHLIQVTQRRDYDDSKAYERNKARDLVRQRKLEPAVDNWRRRLRDEAFVQIKA